MIGRRHHIAGMLGALAAPRVAAAQPARIRHLAIFVAAGLVAGIRTESDRPIWRLFFAELRRLGYTEGKNLTITGWSAEGDTGRFVPLAREIVASRPDVIFAWGSRLALALREAGSDIPTVVNGSNMGGFGLIESYARPGGNMTGVTSDDTWELTGKRIELLHEVRPTATSVGFLAPRVNWDRVGETYFRVPAQRRELRPVAMVLDGPIDDAAYRRAFAEGTRDGLDLLVPDETTENWVHRAVIVELAAQYRLAAIFHDRAYIEVGGLMSYGYDWRDVVPPIVRYVARVLNGERPAEIPVYVYDKVRLVLNLPPARALGITFPPAILARADEVIE